MTTLSSSGEARSARGRRRPRATGDERERAILTTAERLLEDRSLHEISVDDLARGAGISRPTFYFYFPSKEAVLLALLDRMVEDARTDRGDVLELLEDRAGGLRRALAAIYETFRSHRAVTLAAAEARATSAEVRELWAGVMEVFVDETTAAIEAERERGVAPDGVPARDLATALNLMNERVLQATLAGESPAVEEANVIDTLVTVWLAAIYGSSGPPTD
jgi:AcrR family transcriptional regulator